MTSEAAQRAPMLPLRELVDRYRALAGDFGTPVPLTAFNLSRAETEQLFSRRTCRAPSLNYRGDRQNPRSLGPRPSHQTARTNPEILCVRRRLPSTQRRTHHRAPPLSAPCSKTLWPPSTVTSPFTARILKPPEIWLMTAGTSRKLSPLSRPGLKLLPKAAT